MRQHPRIPRLQPAGVRQGRVGNTAILDAASCCGLSLVPPERRNPLLTTSRGMGEMIVEAFAGGCSEFIVGLGGSATCDGGEGMMSVEGIRDLEDKISIELLCDVRNPFLGEKGAAVVFGPQKGASPEDVLLLEKRMESAPATSSPIPASMCPSFPARVLPAALPGPSMRTLMPKFIQASSRSLNIWTSEASRTGPIGSSQERGGQTCKPFPGRSLWEYSSMPDVPG